MRQRIAVNAVTLSVPKVLEAKTGEEKNADVLLRFSAGVGGGGLVNDNEHLYDPTDYKAAVEELNARMARRGKAVGQDGHPGENDVETYGNAPVVWERFWTEEREGGWVEAMGEGIVPNTDAGRNLAPLIRLGVAVAFSSRAMAYREERVMGEKDPFLAANPEKAGKRYWYYSDMKIGTYDAVVTPGFDSATVRAYHEAVQASASLDRMVEAAVTQKLEERMNLEQRVAELEKENAALKAEVETKVKAKADEVTAAMKAELESKLAEALKAAPTAEQRALLERLAKLPTDKVEAALKVLESGADPASGTAVTEAKDRAVALETRIAKLEKDNGGLVDMLRKRDEEAAAEKQRALVREHVAKVTARLVNGAKIAEHLNADCKTVEQVDARLKAIKEIAGLEEVAEGLAASAKGAGTPKGDPAPTDVYAPTSPAGLVDVPDAQMAAIQAVAGGRPRPKGQA